METAELLKKVRRIELKTRSLSSRMFAGEYHSAFKGKGMRFDSVRAYEPGDDIRVIDWNVTARLNEAYVKVFTEERELSLLLLIDISASSDFGTKGMLKKDMITELAAVLAWSAMSNNDQTGAVFFSDRVEKFVPPSKGRLHTLRLISDLIQTIPSHKNTRLSASFDYASKILKKRSTVFIISDFIDSGYQKSLGILARRHEVKAIRVYDQREKELPNVGLIHFKDTETGRLNLLDTSDAVLRKNYSDKWNEHTTHLHNDFLKAGVPLVDIRTDESYIKPLMQVIKGMSKKA